MRSVTYAHKHKTPSRIHQHFSINKHTKNIISRESHFEVAFSDQDLQIYPYPSSSRRLYKMAVSERSTTPPPSTSIHPSRKRPTEVVNFWSARLQLLCRGSIADEKVVVVLKNSSLLPQAQVQRNKSSQLSSPSSAITLNSSRLLSMATLRKVKPSP
jgi:hypothetical protein